MKQRNPFHTKRVMLACGPFLRNAMLMGNYKPDSCIAASRIGMDLLERLGIPSEAVRVEAAVFSPAYARRIHQERRIPDSVEERERWVAEGDGLHSVALGYPIPDLGRPGLHVVLLVEGQFLWDLSIDQANRPEKGLTLTKPLVTECDAAAFKRGQSVTREYPDGTVAVYRIASVRDDTWRQSPNWRRDGHDAPDRAALVDTLLRGIADALAEHVTL